MCSDVTVVGVVVLKPEDVFVGRVSQWWQAVLNTGVIDKNVYL